MSKQKKMFDITRSYARKLNLAQHGGFQFETADIFCTITQKDVPEDSLQDTLLELHTLCVTEVDASIKAYDEKAIETIDADEGEGKKKKKKKIDALGMEAKEAKEIEGFIKRMISAETLEDLKEVGEEIKAAQEDGSLNETQITYLKEKYRKCSKTLKK